MGKIFGLIAGFAITMAVAWFVFPDATARYEGWFGAFWYGSTHGGLVLANAAWHQIDPNHLYKAPNSSTAYTVWWWFGAAMTGISHLGALFSKAE